MREVRTGWHPIDAGASERRANTIDFSGTHAETFGNAEGPM